MDFSYVQSQALVLNVKNPTSLLFVVPSIGTASKVSEISKGADKLANVVIYFRCAHKSIAMPRNVFYRLRLSTAFCEQVALTIKDHPPDPK